VTVAHRFSSQSIPHIARHPRVARDNFYRVDNVLLIDVSLSWKPELLIVCHCYRKREEIVRIISARKAIKNERKEYMKRLT